MEEFAQVHQQSKNNETEFNKDLCLNLGFPFSNPGWTELLHHYGIEAHKIVGLFCASISESPFRIQAGPNFYSDENEARKKGPLKMGLNFGGFFVGQFSNTKLRRASISSEKCPHFRPIQPTEGNEERSKFEPLFLP